MGKKNKKARALEEMVFQGGSLNLKLLGASQLGAEP